jgi:hypothetical protein
MFFLYRVSQKWRTNGDLRCRGDYRKRQKNVKKILLDLFAELEVFESTLKKIVLILRCRIFIKNENLLYFYVRMSEIFTV